ncbi:hypothetical protein MYX76_13885 [Desulfobacterota bacterium AH_259_B03_O07]|nr:hypothetical protein [Desulfobacterota bacterium AH_259_B03_O07]
MKSRDKRVKQEKVKGVEEKRIEVKKPAYKKYMTPNHIRVTPRRIKKAVYIIRRIV